MSNADTDRGADGEPPELVVEFTQRFTIRPPDEIDDPAHAEDWFWNFYSEIGYDMVDTQDKSNYEVVDAQHDNRGRVPTSDETRKEVIEGMEQLVDQSHSGAVMEMLPARCDETVALGLSVAVDALNDGNERVAKAGLEIAASKLDEGDNTDE